jgi:hypothetical protein
MLDPALRSVAVRLVVIFVVAVAGVAVVALRMCR